MNIISASGKKQKSMSNLGTWIRYSSDLSESNNFMKSKNCSEWSSWDSPFGNNSGKKQKSPEKHNYQSNLNSCIQSCSDGRKSNDLKFKILSELSSWDILAENTDVRKQKSQSKLDNWTEFSGNHDVPRSKKRSEWSSWDNSLGCSSVEMIKTEILDEKQKTNNLGSWDRFCTVLGESTDIQKSQKDSEWQSWNSPSQNSSEKKKKLQIFSKQRFERKMDDNWTQHHSEFNGSKDGLECINGWPSWGKPSGNSDTRKEKDVTFAEKQLTKRNCDNFMYEINDVLKSNKGSKWSSLPSNPSGSSGGRDHKFHIFAENKKIQNNWERYSSYLSQSNDMKSKDTSVWSSWDSSFNRGGRKNILASRVCHRTSETTWAQSGDNHYIWHQCADSNRCGGRNRSTVENRWSESHRSRSRDPGRNGSISRSRSRNRNSCHRSRRNRRMRCRFHKFKQGAFIGTDRSRSGPKVSPQVCIDFCMGRCNKGTDCKFLHEDNGNNKNGWNSNINAVENCSSRQNHETCHCKEESNTYAQSFRNPSHTEKDQQSKRQDRFAANCDNFRKDNCHLVSPGRNNASGEACDQRINIHDNATYTFLKMGSCRNGDNCKISHGILSRDNVNDQKRSWDGPTWNETDTIVSMKIVSSDGQGNSTENINLTGSLCDNVYDQKKLWDGPTWNDKIAAPKIVSSDRWSNCSGNTNYCDSLCAHVKETKKSWDGPKWNETINSAKIMSSGWNTTAGNMNYSGLLCDNVNDQKKSSDGPTWNGRMSNGCGNNAGNMNYVEFANGNKSAGGWNQGLVNGKTAEKHGKWETGNSDADTGIPKSKILAKPFDNGNPPDMFKTNASETLNEVSMPLEPAAKRKNSVLLHDDKTEFYLNSNYKLGKLDTKSFVKHIKSEAKEWKQEQPSDGLGNMGEMRILEIELMNFVKEILNPIWHDGRMSKDIYKTIVKKVVDKVTVTIQAFQIPKTHEQAAEYISYYQLKLSNLIQAYVDRYLKS